MSPGPRLGLELSRSHVHTSLLICIFSIHVWAVSKPHGPRHSERCRLVEANTHTHTQHTGHDANVLSDMGYPSAKHHGSSKQGERLPEGGLGRGFKVRWHGTACAYSRQGLGKGKGPAEWASGPWRAHQGFCACRGVSGSRYLWGIWGRSRVGGSLCADAARGFLAGGVCSCGITGTPSWQGAQICLVFTLDHCFGHSTNVVVKHPQKLFQISTLINVPLRSNVAPISSLGFTANAFPFSLWKPES